MRKDRRKEMNRSSTSLQMKKKMVEKTSSLIFIPYDNHTYIRDVASALSNFHWDQNKNLD